MQRLLSLYSRLLATFFMFLGLLWTVNAQELEFESFDDELGGRQSSVYHIHKDTQGFLWFSSDTDGLLRYDGYELIRWFNPAKQSPGHISASLISSTNELWAATWGHGVLRWRADLDDYEIFTHQENEQQGLADNRVQNIFEDREGRIFFGSLNGLSYFHPEQNRILRLSTDNPLYQARIWGVAESTDGLWFATSQGLIQLAHDLTQWQQHLPNPQVQGSNRLNEIRTVLTVDNEVWIGSDEGVFLWNTQEQTFQNVTFPAKRAGERIPRVNDLMLASKRAIWVGTSDGLYRVQRSTLQYEAIQEGVFSLVPDIDIRALAIDNNKSIWLGTRELGMMHSRARLADFDEVVEFAPHSLEDILKRNISAVHSTVEGTLWLGVPHGVVRYNQSTEAWRLWQFPENSTARTAESLLKDTTGRLWIAANNNLFYIEPSGENKLISADFIYEALGIQKTTVTKIYQHVDGYLWFGVWGLGIAEYDPQTQKVRWVFEYKDRLSGDVVYDITSLPNGDIWLVNRYSGLFYLPKGAKEWLAYRDFAAQPLPSSNLLCSYATTHTLWVCSEQGLIALDLLTGHVKVYSKADGLPSNRVVGLVEDLEGTLWITTSHGLALFNRDKEMFVNFGLSDGLPVLAFLRRSIVRTPDGKIVAGTVAGAIEFNPKTLVFDSQPPLVGFSRLWIDEKEMTRSLSFESPIIELTRSHRNIRVQYAVLDFHESNRNTGRYRLLGLNHEWSAWSDLRNLTFNTLPLGYYVLEIEGRNSLGIASVQPLRIEIFVHQPWWYATWVWLLAAVAIILFFVLVINWRIRSLERLNKRLDLQVRERTQELEELNKVLQEQSQTDYLTQLPNRRGFTERFNWYAAQLRREQITFSLVLLDVDHFKQFNDTYGHDAGDLVLVELAKLLRKELRELDIPGRWGGEEFSILLPNTGRKNAFLVCNKIREKLAAHIVHYQGHQLQITATFGIYESADASPDKLTIEHWMTCADQALYEGKKLGRNRVVIYAGD